MAARLTTTTYCLLALLRLGPSSAYDLTKHMQRSAVGALWPRTEAAIYREARKLAEEGLADVVVETDGRRERSRYSITAAGERALADWLDEPGAGLRFECEAALKAFFGDATSIDSLRTQLAALRDDLAAARTETHPIVAGWLDGQLRYPHRIHYTAMSADLIARLRVAASGWAQDWLGRLDAWDDTQLDPAKEREAREIIAALLQELA